MRHIWLLACAVVLATATSAAAQWLKLPTPGIPRLADGKPNLSAAAPRTADGKPDFSGLWKNDGGDRLYNNITADLQPGDVAPWANAIYQKRRLEFGKDSMETLCLPMGPAYLTTRYRMNRIIQTPTLVAFLYEDGQHREIWMDGRALEPDPNPTWMGYSVGRLEGDVLVVESNGYTERSWLDFDGHPHTEALAYHRALHAAAVRPHRCAGDDGRSQGVSEADHVLDADEVPGRYRDARSGVREQRKSRERIAVDQTGAGGRPCRRRRSRATSAYTTWTASPSTSSRYAVGATLWIDYDEQGKEELVPLTRTQVLVVGRRRGVLDRCRRRHRDGDSLCRRGRAWAAPQVAAGAGVRRPCLRRRPRRQRAVAEAADARHAAARRRQAEPGGARAAHGGRQARLLGPVVERRRRPPVQQHRRGPAAGRRGSVGERALS